MIRTLGFILAILVPAFASTRVAQPRTVSMALQASGSFVPSSVIVRRGDTVKWTGLGPTDSIVRVAAPGVSDACDDTRDVVYGAVADEFTGPRRVGVPGIWIANGNSSPVIQAIAVDCAACPGTDDQADGCAYASDTDEYCPQTGGTEFLAAQYDYSWVTGFKIDVDWDDVEPTEDAYDFSSIITEAEKAKAAGKVLSVSFSAGVQGTPTWLEDESAADPACTLANDCLVVTEDVNEGTPGPTNCGQEQNMGNPASDAYRTHFFELYDALADELDDDAGLINVVVEVRLSGANKTSYEAKLPSVCCDGTVGTSHCEGADSDADGTLDTVNGNECTCNPQNFAEAGFTINELSDFYVEQAQAVIDAWGEAPLVVTFPLIQDGWPKIEDATNFEGDTLLSNAIGNPALCPTCVTSDNSEQSSAINMTEQIIGRGTVTFGSRWRTMHLGIGLLNADTGLTACTFASPVVEVGGLQRANLLALGTEIGKPRETGCPNGWAAEVTVEDGYLSGYQHKNESGGIGSATDWDETGEDISSVLWNMTINTNADQLEVYAKYAWQLHEMFGASQDIDPDRTCASVGGSGAGCTKSLAEWNNELRSRNRQNYATIGDRTRYPDDPYPTSHQHTFTVAATHIFYDPAKCGAVGDVPTGTVVVQ